MLKNVKLSKKTIWLIVLIIVALLSMFVVSKIATSTQFHASTIQTLDEKKIDVVELTAATAATSMAVSAVPGDVTSPIANQILELSSYLLIVVCAIFLEKFLLTTTGYLTFSALIPIACVLLAIYLYKEKEILKVFALKLIAFGMAIFLVIPVSVQISNVIDATFDTKQTIELAKQSSNEIDTAAQDITDGEEDNLSSWWYKLKESVTSNVTNVKEKAENAINNFIDAIAALIITACVIPIIVIFIFLWIIKIIFGVDIKIPKLKKNVFSKKAKSVEEKE